MTQNKKELYFIPSDTKFSCISGEHNYMLDICSMCSSSEAVNELLKDTVSDRE